MAFEIYAYWPILYHAVVCTMRLLCSCCFHLSEIERLRLRTIIVPAFDQSDIAVLKFNNGKVYISCVFTKHLSLKAIASQ